MVKWKMKSWTVTRVVMWLLCDHGVEASKDWVFVAHFIHLFNTTMPMSCTDVHSGAPMSHFLHRRVGMGCQALNFLSRGNYVFKMSRMHACLQNVQPLYNTFNAPALWKTSQVWVSSSARQERPSMFFNFTKITLVNFEFWIKCHVVSRYCEMYENIAEYNTINHTKKREIFCCFNKHYFSSHDQHVWSWTHDHTPANLTISYPGMI